LKVIPLLAGLLVRGAMRGHWLPFG